MPSSDRDQTSLDRHGRTIRRAYAPFRLSANQRQRHHALLDQAARRRATSRLRPHLAEAAAIATIALLVIIALVTWQALQPDDDEQVAAPAERPGPTTSVGFAVENQDAGPQALYMLSDGDIVGIDPVTGEEILHIDANTRFDYPFEYPQLAVSYEAGRIAVPDLLNEEDEFRLGVKIYRMSDGALDREISIQTILRCIGGPCINVTFSQDGQRLHVQQYETQPGEVGNQADYWLGTFDLNAGKWLPDVDLQGCGSSNHLEAIAPDEVIALCSEAGLYVVDTEQFTARSAGYRFNNAAMVSYGRTFIIAYDDRAICVQPRDGDRTSATCHSTAKADSEEDYVQPAASLGMSPDGTRLYVPTGTHNVPEDSERNYITSRIAVISTENWAVERTIDVGFSFAEIVFSTDASTAYVISEHEDDVAKLMRIDLQSGDQTELASGAISSLVLAPRWDDEGTHATPDPTPESDTAMQLDYQVRNYDVVGINPETGEEMQHIDVNIGLPSPILAVNHESGRIAVGDLIQLQNGNDQLESSNDDEYGVKIYRMSDGTLEQQIPTASLVTCREECEAIIFSQDGQRLHVYQRDWPGGTDASSIRYLLTTYDLEAREWLQDVDLGKCGLVNAWGFVDDQILRIECSNSSPVEVDTSSLTVVANAASSIDTGADEAYFIGADGNHVVWITPDDAIHAAAIEDPEPFTLVGPSDLKSNVRFDNGVVVWSEPDPGCATGCAGAYGKRIGEDETFVIAPGGNMDGVEVSDAYVAISYP